MKLTDRKKSLAGAQLTDLVHIVKTGDTSQNSAGSSFKIEMGDYKNLFSFNGGTITGSTVFTNNVTVNTLSATTISTNSIVTNTLSATTYLGLPKDIYVTGGTYSSGTAVFRNNTGGTFSVSGFSTGGASSLYWSGGTGTNSIIALGGNNIASGNNSLAEGFNTTASGFSSHAEGIYTEALGINSHAEGEYTKSIGQSSHSEGQASEAIGLGSHAEGSQTKSIGEYSHAEGLQTIASGQSSHVEGDLTEANGDVSHAGGYQSVANGLGSFIHGYNSQVNGDYSIVLGREITGDTADTTYVDNLNIKTVPIGTPVNNLGVDADGRVVVGSNGLKVEVVKTSNTWVRNTQITVPASLPTGSVIISVTPTIECAVANNGYQVGDIVSVATVEPNDSGGIAANGIGIQFRADTFAGSYIKANIEGKIYIPTAYILENNPAGVFDLSTTTQWVLRFVIVYI